MKNKNNNNRGGWFHSCPPTTTPSTYPFKLLVGRVWVRGGVYCVWTAEQPKTISIVSTLFMRRPVRSTPRHRRPATKKIFVAYSVHGMKMWCCRFMRKIPFQLLLQLHTIVQWQWPSNCEIESSKTRKHRAHSGVQFANNSLSPNEHASHCAIAYNWQKCQKRQLRNPMSIASIAMMRRATMSVTIGAMHPISAIA